VLREGRPKSEKKAKCTREEGFPGERNVLEIQEEKALCRLKKEKRNCMAAREFVAWGGTGFRELF